MRVWSRIALVVFLISASFFAAPDVAADHYEAQCPLSLADSTPPATEFDLSPHGVFRNGALVYVLRGQVLATYTTNDVGNLQIVREDFIGSLAAHETDGGVAYANNHLFISSEAGLEIYNLTNVRVGGSAPIRVHRAPGFHYRRIAVSGNRLAGLYPSTDLPCYPTGGSSVCQNRIEILDISTLTNPVLVGVINSGASSRFRGLNDIAFHSGNLIAVSEQALIAFDISNPIAPRDIADVNGRGGQWLVSNGESFLAVGRDTEIDVYTVRPGVFPYFTREILFALPHYLAIERANDLRFSRNAFYDETNARLITMIEEIDPMTLDAARTIAFDVFDLTVPRHEGSAERIYEEVSLLEDEEVKYNPVAVGQYVYVIGEESGLQSYGSCGVATGRIELDSPLHLACGGGQLYGWVTGQYKIVNVEIFLDNTSLGAASIIGTRRNVSSVTPAWLWRLPVNLDNTARGEYQLRAIATDALGTRRQFAMKRLFFEGPGRNCTNPRRRAVR